MATELITLPIRVGVRAATLALRGGEELAARALALASTLAGGSEREPEPVAPAPPSAPVADAGAPLPDRGPPLDLDAPPLSVPAHVSEDPALAAELAEPGAEDGAGAEVRLAEPWPGYREFGARDIVERMAVSDAAELAAIQLFESAHRRRPTVLSAVHRALELTTRGS